VKRRVDPTRDVVSEHFEDGLRVRLAQSHDHSSIITTDDLAHFEWEADFSWLLGHDHLVTPSVLFEATNFRATCK